MELLSTYILLVMTLQNDVASRSRGALQGLPLVRWFRQHRPSQLGRGGAGDGKDRQSTNTLCGRNHFARFPFMYENETNRLRYATSKRKGPGSTSTALRLLATCSWLC